MKKYILYTSLVALALFSCKTKKSSTVEEKKEVKSQLEMIKETDLEKFIGNYKVVFLDGFMSEGIVVQTVKIDDQGRISGNNGCNSYFGSVNLQEDKIFKKIGSTRIGCEGKEGEAESIMMDVLGKVTNLKKEEDKVFFFSNQIKIMTAEVITIEEFDWNVTWINGVELEDGASPEFRIANGFINGNNGCNSFVGKVTQDGYHLKFNELGFAEMVCENFNSKVGKAFEKALLEVASFSLQENNIHLFNRNGERVMTAVKPG